MHHFRAGSTTSLLALALSSAALLAGCSGTRVFAGQNAFAIVGNPPPPPPPPKKEEPPPPPKKEEPPPRVELRDNKIEIREKIQFEHDKATILKESFGLLDEIVSVIKKNPQIKKLEIGGHASSDGDDKHNLKLSDDRAKAVAKYFTDHGVNKDTLAPKGYGETKPIGDNNTEEGREKNRRVEFIVLEQDVTKKKVQIDPKTGKETVLEEKTSEIKKDTGGTAPPPPEKKDDKKKDEKKPPAPKPPAPAAKPPAPTAKPPAPAPATSK